MDGVPGTNPGKGTIPPFDGITHLVTARKKINCGTSAYGFTILDMYTSHQRQRASETEEKFQLRNISFIIPYVFLLTF